MDTNALVRIDDLVQNIGLPDYPPMPTAAEPLSFDEVAPVDIPQPED